MAGVATQSADASKSAKRTTRSSLRHSLNLASVGKALADVMNKEGNGTPRRRSVSGSNVKDPSLSKRVTTVGFSRKGPALGTVPEGLSKVASPDQSTVTARARRSSSSLQRPARASVDETGVKITSVASPQSGTLNRTGSVLRPRSTAGSGLPKYRPKSMIVEGPTKRPLSPVVAGTRRKHSSSEEEKDSTSSACAHVVHSPMPKAERPISPIPRRASSIRASSPARSDTSKSSPRLRNSTRDRESPATSTPPRPKKTQKPSTSPMVKKTGLPRPSSRGSPATTSGSPQTPSSARSTASRYLSDYSSGRESPSPLRTSFVANSSPSARKKTSKPPAEPESESNQNTPTAPPPKASPNVITADPGNESVDDIEFMLAEVVSPTAPTPAIPRLNTVFYPPQNMEPETPSKPSQLQSRSSMLCLSVSSRTSAQSQAVSRQQSPERRPAALRNSIAAWNKLADMSLEINAAELGGGLITELDLPSTPAMVSPSPSILRLESEMGLTDSPAPLTLPSPGGYTSISQVLLPAVTPSPAPAMRYLHSSNFDDEDMTVGRGDFPPVDSGASMMLKLQLAQMENLAKERLYQITHLQEQMRYLKQTREREELELASHINELEERLQDTLLAHEQEREQRERGRTARAELEANTEESDPHAECRSSFEEYAREAERSQQDAVATAISELSARERSERACMYVQVQKQQRLGFTVRDAQNQWQSVKSLADDELECIRGNRETLSVLRAGLDFFEAQLRGGRCVPNHFSIVA